MPFNMARAAVSARVDASVIVIAHPGWAWRLCPPDDPDSAVSFYLPCDYVHAMKAIVEQRPRLVLLDARFAATSRAAALVARVTRDPQLRGTEVRTLHEEEPRSLVPGGHAERAIQDAAVGASMPVRECGARHAARLVMREWVLVFVNGSPAQLVDISAGGAPFVLPGRLRPRQSVRVTMTDESVDVRLEGEVVWASIELAGTSISHRAGVQFCEADRPLLESFCRRHAASAIGPEALAPWLEPRQQSLPF